MARRSRIGALALVVGMAIAGCGDGEAAPGAAETGAPPTTAAAATTSEAAETTTTAEATTTTVADTTTTTAGGAPPADFPPERTELVHGGFTPAVVLAAAPAVDEPALAAAMIAAQDAGYSTVGPTDCDAGAPAVLGAPEGSYTVSVYFETAEDAQQAVAAFEADGYAGAAAGTVQTFCLD